MKKLIIGLLLIVQYQLLFAQSVGIGTTTPNPAAQLDVTSITKGLLIPRMTGAQRVAIPAPVAGLLVYQTNTELSPPSAIGFYLYDAGGWKRIARADELSTASWTVSGSNQYSSVSGNVGIGINSPHASAKLDITSSTGGLLIPRMSIATRYSINGPAEGLLVYDSTLKEFWYYDGTDWQKFLNGSYDYWNKSNSRRWVYNSLDSIGIGTSTPTCRLQVNGAIRGIGTITSTTSMVIDDAAAILTLQSSTVDKGFMQLSGDDVRIGTFSSNNAGNFRIRVNGDNTVNVTPSNNVGIGTESPTAKLHVMGKIYAQGNAEVIKLNGVNPNIGFYQSGVYRSFISQSGTDLSIGVNGGDILLDGTNVGVGTLTPTSKLHVVGRIAASGSGEVLKLDGTNPNMAFYQGGVYRSFISQSGTELFMGVNNGNLHLDAQQVAIGNVNAAASAYKLTVAGKIICEELKVKLQSSGWPDYVFAEQYKLPALPEVEKFILQNKHLPNIPSAAEVEKNGLEIGDMQKRMMEKIEELTLYVIELQKQVDDLKGKK